MRPAMTIRHIIKAVATCVLALGLLGCTTCSKNDEAPQKAAQAEKAKPKRARKKKPRPPAASRPETRKVQVGEAERRYMFLRARGTSAKKPAPVLVMLHEDGGSAREITSRRDLMSGASKLGYLVAAPIAAKEGWGPGLCSSTSEAAKPAAAAKATGGKPATAAIKAPAAAKDAKGTAAKAETAPAGDATAAGSDVDYMKAVLADLATVGADQKRLYLVATGGAAAFAQRLVSEIPGQFAAIVLFAPEDCKQKVAAASSPIPALVVTGDEPAEADAGAPAAKTASVPGLDYWLKANTCDAKPVVSDGGLNEERYTCKADSVVRVNLSTSAKKWPRKMGGKYSMRYMHEFFKATKR